MGIEAISQLVAIVLALSLATERLVVMLRTPSTILWLIPLGKWLNNEKPDPQEDGIARDPQALAEDVVSVINHQVTP